MEIRNGSGALFAPRRRSVGMSIARYGSAEPSGVHVRSAVAIEGAWITRSP